METIFSFSFLIEAIGTICLCLLRCYDCDPKASGSSGSDHPGGNNRRRRRYAQRHSSWKGASQPVHQPDLCDHAFVTVLVLFLIIRFNQHILTGPYIVIYERIMNIFDAVGLAAFTVTGIDTAMMAGYGELSFPCLSFWEFLPE